MSDSNGIDWPKPRCIHCGAEVEEGEPKDFDDISGEGPVYCDRCDLFRPEEEGD